MGIFDRIILTIYTFSLTFISAAFVALAVGWRAPLIYIEQGLDHPQGRWAIGLAGAIVFIASVRLLYFGFRRRGFGPSAVILDGELGEVRISLAAVESLVARVAREQRGVREVRSLADLSGGRISVYLRTWVSPEASIPDLSVHLQREIARQVRHVTGAEVDQVRIDVVNLAPEQRRSRVE